jgi:hypothetical protein
MVHRLNPLQDSSLCAGLHERIFFETVEEMSKYLLTASGLFFLLFVALGFFAIAVMDDYWHAFFIVKNHSLLTAPFFWTYGQYFHWTGRVVTSFLQGIFTLQPLHTNYISGLNAGLFLLALSFWFYEFLKKIEKNSSVVIQFTIIQTLMVLVFCYSVLGEAIYWAAGVYVWPFVFLVTARHLLESKSQQFSRMFSYLVFFSLGNANELLILPTCYLFWDIFRRRVKDENKINLTPLFFAFILGVLINIFSPGLFKHLLQGSYNVSLNPLVQLSNAIYVFEKGFHLLGWKFLISLPLSLSFNFSSPLEPSWLKVQVKNNIILACSSLIVLIPLFGFTTDRTYLYFLVFLSISFFWFIQLVKSKFPILNLPKNTLEVLCLLSLIGGSAVLVKNILDARNMREAFINQQKQIEQMSITSKNIITKKLKRPMDNHILFYSDLSDNPEYWNNQVQAKYYGVSTIMAL